MYLLSAGEMGQICLYVVKGQATTENDNRKSNRKHRTDIEMLLAFVGGKRSDKCRTRPFRKETRRDVAEITRENLN